MAGAVEALFDQPLTWRYAGAHWRVAEVDAASSDGLFDVLGLPPVAEGRYDAASCGAVGQVGAVVGADQAQAQVDPDDIAAPEAALDADERAQLTGAAPRTQALASADPAVAASPTPLLVIVGEQDTVTLTDTGLAACNRALEPKQLVTIPGGHFAPVHHRVRPGLGRGRRLLPQPPGTERRVVRRAPP